jgi:hypothetical protein
MSNILTDAQAANFIRSSSTDSVMLQLLPLIDEYLLNATGHDWASDSTKDKTAITAAGMLLSYWYDNPGMIGQMPATVLGILVQLEAKALSYRKYQFAGISGAGGISLSGARKGDVVVKLVGVYGVSEDQSAKFESVITVDNQIQQVLAGNLSDNLYVVVLKHPADDVNA